MNVSSPLPEAETTEREKKFFLMIIIIIIIIIIFILLKYAMTFLHKFCSFMEFWSVLLTFVSMVGLHGERRKTERKGKMFPITGPPQRERRNF